jgi:tetratricopeptide (TPR) repeat protein
VQSVELRSFRNVPVGNFDDAMFYMNDHSARKWELVAARILGQFLLRGSASMRPVLWGLLVFIVCLPLAFVLLIVAAAKYPPMDVFTMKLPDSLRTTVAELILRNAPYANVSVKLVDRAIELDPENADAWTRRCHGNGEETKYDQQACRKAIALDPSAWNFNGLGTAQENARDYCTAEDSYTNAIKASANSAYSLRNMARAALRCGHVGASVAGFEVAEGLDAKAAADPDEDDDTKNDLLADREYLAVAYNRTNQPVKATAICTKAHADWKACHCELTDAAVKCLETPVGSASKK